MATRITGSFILGENPKDQKTMRIKNPVYLTADRMKAVPAGHPEAASVLCGRNAEVSEKVAKQYDLTEAGAPGQEGDTFSGPRVPHMVNPNCSDGINTDPDAVSATPVTKGTAPESKAEAKEPRLDRKEPPKSAQPLTEPKGKAKPGRPAKSK